MMSSMRKLHYGEDCKRLSQQALHLAKGIWSSTPLRFRVLAILLASSLALYLRITLADAYLPLRDHWRNGYDFEHPYRQRLDPGTRPLSHLLFRAQPRPEAGNGGGARGRDPEGDGHDDIPNMVHMIPPPNFGFLDYLAVASVAHVIRPETIFMHITVDRWPRGWWWEAALRHYHRPSNGRSAVPFVMKETEEITEIFGRNISNPSHKADIIRLNALLDYGGIYIDTDAVVLKSFHELLREDTVLAVESRVTSRRSQVVVEGLCNAIILAKKGAGFIRAWKEEYRSFDQNQWNWHSVQVPWQMAKVWSKQRLNITTSADGITVLDSQAFFWPTYDRVSMEAVHGRLRPDRDFGRLGIPPSSRSVNVLERSDGYAYHLWRSFYMLYYGAPNANRSSNFEFETSTASADDEFIPPLSPHDIMTRDTAFNVIVRKFIVPELLEEWDYAKEQVVLDTV